MDLLFNPSTIEPEDVEGLCLWFIFQDGSLIILDHDEEILIPQTERFEQTGLDAERRHYLGTLQGQHCYAAEVKPGVSLPQGYQSMPLRQLLGLEDEFLFHLAGRAQQILTWDRDHQFCSRCGSQTRFHETDRAKHCDQCGYIQYPKISPCIIVLITRGDEVLLARSPHFPGRFYSTLAGFIEPGESIEEALRREVYEEVGLEVTNITYKSSQPWPFPHSLMIGFYAEYAGGEIRIDDDEIEDAQWFPVDRLPLTPPEGSIAHDLIQEYVQKRLNPWGA